MSHQAVDIILVNYRSAALILSALARLRPAGQTWAHETIHIVDNSEDESEAEQLRRSLQTLAPDPSDLRLTVMPRNVGFAAACNAAWAQSRAPFVLLHNPDAQISTSAIRGLAQHLADNPKLAAISPRTWWDAPGGWVLPRPSEQTPMHRLHRALRSRMAPQTWATHGARQTAAQMASGGVLEVSSLAGALLMLRRSAVQACGGLFDESFFMYFEDAELSQRLRRSGWRLGLATDVDGIHTWRRQPHKAPMMEEAERTYLSRQPALYRWARTRWPGLERMGALGPPLHRCSSVESAVASLGPIRALSPEPSGDPAWVRAGLEARVLTPAEWQLLEPGTYWAWTDRGWEGWHRQAPEP